MFVILKEFHMLRGQMDLLNCKKNLRAHLRMCLHDTPENWSIQVYFFACAHNTQPLSHLHVSPIEKVFHKQPMSENNFVKRVHNTVLISSLILVNNQPI